MATPTKDRAGGKRASSRQAKVPAPPALETRDVAKLKEVVAFQATSLAEAFRLVHTLSQLLITRLAPHDEVLRELDAHLSINYSAATEFSALVTEAMLGGTQSAEKFKKVLARQRKARSMHQQHLATFVMAAPQKNAALAEAQAQNNAALAEAQARGAEFRSEIMSQPFMVTGEDIAKRLGISRQAVDRKRQAAELFALSWGSKRVLYPAWQIEPNVLLSMKSILGILGAHDAWSIFRFFTSPEASSGDQTPLEMLRAGKAQEVLAAARSFADRA
jgi:hypothetical protein